MSPKQRGKRSEPGQQRSILVVDDDPINRKVFALTLSKKGYCVRQAADGYRGFVEAHDDRPDLIVMDVCLPGVSGLEVTRTLKDSPYTKDIPIVIATAYLIDEAALRDSGCDGYIPKPFVLRKFLELIDAMVEQADEGLAAA